MKGILLDIPRGRVLVPISGAIGTVYVTVIDTDQLRSERLDTFDAIVI